MGRQGEVMQMVRRMFEGLGMLLACAYAAWFLFVDPIQAYLTFNDDGRIPIVALAVNTGASVFGVVCAVYSIWIK
jgi:hypothetical protein